MMGRVTSDDMIRRTEGRPGFTLVEVMVAITISAGLLLAGRLLLEQITATEHVIVADSAAQDTTFHHALTLESIIRNLDVSTDSTHIFHGNEHIVQFASWCEDTTVLPIPRTPCMVQLAIDTTVTLVTSVAPASVLKRLPAVGEFRYLGDARDGGQWYRSWGPGILAPLAIGVVVGTDTTVLRIGERG